MRSRIVLTGLLPCLVLGAATCILAPGVAKLGLYIDDFPYLYDTPRLTHQFGSFVSAYTAVHGVYRPVALLWYWVVYSLYEWQPAVSHLIPLLIHAGTAFLLFRILISQGFSRIMSLVSATLYLLNPFAVEQYTWLSATPGTVANFLFFLAVERILSAGLSWKKGLALVGILGLVSAFLYESTFFLWIVLAVFCAMDARALGKKPLVLAAAVAGFPILLYGVSKLLVKGTDVRPLVDSFPAVVANFQSLLGTVAELVWGYPTSVSLWSNHWKTGIGLLSVEPLVFASAVTAIMGIVLYMLGTRGDGREKGQINRWTGFWLACFVLSIPPLLANREFYFGFRSLFLPSVLGMVGLLVLFRHVLGRNGWMGLAAGMMGLGILFAGVDVAMLQNYRTRYEADMQISGEIARAVEKYDPGAARNSVTVLLRSDLPFDSRDTYLHADYVLSCFFYEWSAPSCLTPATDRVGTIGIRNVDGRITVPKGKNWQTIESVSPRLELRLTTDGKIQVEGMDVSQNK